MRLRFSFLRIVLISQLFVFQLYAAGTDSVAVKFNSENEKWSAEFYHANGDKYRTLEIDTTGIDAFNIFLSEAGENAKIDLFSPISYVVTKIDPYQGITPLNGQTIDFHYQNIEILNPLKLRMNGIFALRKHQLTLKNFRLSGYITYAVWALGCDDLTVENLDIDMDRENGLALFIRPRGDYRPRNLTIKGDVFINGGHGHAIEFTSVDTVRIGDVTLTNNIGGCGINASGSTQIKIGNVYGYKNCYSLEGDGGGYATLRYSNAGEYLECNGIYSRRCGRGYMITQGDNSALPGVLGQHFSTVEVVDIRHSVNQNIFIRGTLPTNNQVLSGTVSESLYQAQNLVFLEGETNVVSLGILEQYLDTSVLKTVRLNELRFGFYDLTADEHSENYFRDRNCDGFGYSKTLDKKDAFMEWNIVSGNGNHEFQWKYACAGSKKAKLLVNAKYISTIEFAGTGSDTIWQTNSFKIENLKASDIKNLKLIAVDDRGLPLIDFLEVEALGANYSLKDFSTAADSLRVSFDPPGTLNQIEIVPNSLAPFTVYPNPNRGLFTVKASRAFDLPFDLKIYDIYGSLLPYTQIDTENGIHVQLNNQLNAWCFVKISSNNFLQTFKIHCFSN